MSVLIQLLSWLMGSKAGRITGVLIVAVATAAMLILSAYKRGQGAEKAKATAAKLEALQNRMTVDDEIAKMPRAARRERLRQWVHD